MTEEFAYHNGHYGTREDVVFLINGIPVLVIECKNATKDEGIALGIGQIRHYHVETPELFVPQQLFTATDAIGFSYGVTWNTVRRNIFNWKSEPDGQSKPDDDHREEVGNLEAKIKSFCTIPRVLAFLKEYILFAEKDEELNKYILRQYQTEGVTQVVHRALDPVRRRGLVWHTQGSGKTFTMIKTAEMLFRAPEADKPTVLLMIDRNELEDQMLKNLAALGLGNLEHASSIRQLNELLKNDYRGIIVTMIHKQVPRHAGGPEHPKEHLCADRIGVDREACAHYKHALDKFLPPEYSEVVYTGSNNDSKLLKEFHLDPKRERQIRKSFGKLDQMPKILIVTEKLLTGFDAPVLYAMYLDKPMRDHTLLQAIARVNRPYENEAREMVKPHGFVLDFVGIFDNLEKALAFDSDEINAIVKDIRLLKALFKAKMEDKVLGWLELIAYDFNDKDVDNLIEHFRDKERRKEFFKEYKEIEMLYEIISPDAYLRPFIEDYTTLSKIYLVVRNAYTKRVMVDRDFQRKTNELVQAGVGTRMREPETPFIFIDKSTLETIAAKDEGKATKVINLVKAIEKSAEEQSDDPFLVAMAERAKVVQEAFEARQSTTEKALEDLMVELEKNQIRKKQQAEKRLDGLSYFVLCKLTDDDIANAEAVSGKIRTAFAKHPGWKDSDGELRELRKAVTVAVYSEEDDLDKVAGTVDSLFILLEKAFRR